LTTSEEDLILFLLRHDSYFVPIAQSLPLEWIDQSGRGGQLLMALLNEAAHGHFAGLREAISTLDDELRTEAARLSAETYAGRDDEKDILPRANSIMKSFHSRHVQALMRSLDSRIASTSRDDIATLNQLQSEKIALRKSHATPPTLTTA
jgi:plasmid stabilization system protein ParE